MTEKLKKNSRRNFIKFSALGGIVIASGVSIWQASLTEAQELVENEKFDYQFLTLDDRLLLWALLPAYLEGALADNDNNQKLIVLHNIDAAISYLSRSTKDELRELFNLLGFQLGRAYLARVWTSWNSATLKQLQNFLTNWRESSLSLLRAGYLGLHQIILGSYYGEASSWERIGYPGPPQFNLPESFYEQFD